MVLEATVRLVPEEARRLLVVLGYPSMPEAADAVPELLSAAGGRLVACEGLDARITDLVRARGGRRAGAAARRGVAVRRGRRGRMPRRLAAQVVAASGALGHRVVDDLAEQAALWRIREDGAGLAARA